MTETPSPSADGYFDNFDGNFANTLNQNINSAMQNSMFGMEDYSGHSLRSAASQNQVAYDHPYVATLRSQVEDHEFVSGSLSNGFRCASPLPIGSPTLLSEHYVNPKQTFLEPFRPTPLLMDCYSSPDEQLQYYISPMRPTPQPTHPEDQMSTRSTHARGPALSIPSSIFHMQQTGRRVGKRSKPPTSDDGITRVVAGKFFCTHEGCDKGTTKAFTRQEHLRRHELTHSKDRKLKCPFCPKRFQDGRKDNLKDHLSRHAKPHSKGKRTRYDPRAIEEIQNMAMKEKRAR
jgi:hypothetical protein